MKIAISLAGLLLCSACAMAAELPSDFAEAVAAAEKSAAKNPNYDPNSLQPYFFEQVMSHCANLSFKHKTPFELVVVLNDRGHATKVYRQPSTPMSDCLEQWIAKSIFPPPPSAPYFAHFDLRFDQPR